MTNTSRKNCKQKEEDDLKRFIFFFLIVIKWIHHLAFKTLAKRTKFQGTVSEP